MQYLVPNGDKKVKGGYVTTFEFQPKDEKWLWCEYGTPANQIAKQLDGAGTKCDLTTKRDRHGAYTEVKVVCREDGR
jgi:hypothetical protein